MTLGRRSAASCCSPRRRMRGCGWGCGSRELCGVRAPPEQQLRNRRASVARWLRGDAAPSASARACSAGRCRTSRSFTPTCREAWSAANRRGRKGGWCRAAQAHRAELQQHACHVHLDMHLAAARVIALRARVRTAMTHDALVGASRIRHACAARPRATVHSCIAPAHARGFARYHAPPFPIAQMWPATHRRSRWLTRPDPQC